jgi:molybdate transport system ATP-binding protein
VSRFDLRFPADGSLIEVVDMELVSGVVTIIYGPNGAGKTTILRRLAGIGTREPLLECAYQPQSPYLFHGSAGWNLGLGLNTEEAARAGILARKLGLGEVLPLPAHTLSGGERHRLALARALASRSRWVLLDEPLAAIDRSDRTMVLELLVEELEGRSALVVTHDLDEAAALGDRIVVVENGRLLQQGQLPDVLRGPVSAQVARILGFGNIVEGQGASSDGYTTVVVGELTVVGVGEVQGPARAIIPGDSVIIGRDVATGSSARNRWQGTVVEIRPRASVLEVDIDVGFLLSSLITPGSADEIGLEVGASVVASVKATAVTVVPA